MAFLTPDELYTHLYEESIETISRQDEAIPLAAIDTAIAEAYGYLGAYDREKIFSAEGAERNALLLTLVKDIAVWHFICRCNAGVEVSMRQSRYECAIAWLQGVQRSEIRPNLPVAEDTDGDGKPDGSVGEFLYGSNPKRIQHF